MKMRGAWDGVREVLLGPRDGTWHAVREGLAGGELVVSEGAYLVRSSP